MRRPRKLLLAASVLGLCLLALGATLASATAPTVTIGPATPSYITAHVTGEINPNGGPSASAYYFEYSRDPGTEGWSYIFAGELTEEEAAGSAPIPVSGDLEGLKSGSEYQVRLTAVYEGTEYTSPEPNQTFTTLPVAAPTVAIDPTATTSYTSAEITGSINPNGGPLPVTYYVEYREAGGEGWPLNINAGEISGAEAEGNSPIPVSGQLTDLKPGQAYEARLTAVSEGTEYFSPEPHAAFTTLPVAAPEVTIDPVSAITDTAASFSGTVDPDAPGDSEDEAQDPAFDTEWSFSCTPECPGLGGGTVEADDDPHPVSVDASGLEPNITYTLTLTGTNAGGEDTAQVTFTTEAIPPTAGDNASGAAETKATIAGFVNPHNTSTDYWFGWGTDGPCSANPCTATPIQSLTTGNQPIHVHADLNGLTVGTTYHYRLLATSPEGTVEGRDRTVSTSIALPDNRAYELVSPISKNGSDVNSDSGRTRVAVDGDAIQFTSLAGIFSDTRGTGVQVDYLAQRSKDGWSTHGITPPQDSWCIGCLIELKWVESRYEGEMSDDLDTGVFISNRLLTPDGANVENVNNIYRRTDLLTAGTGAYELLSDSITPLARRGDYNPAFADASQDFSHILFTARAGLTADAPPQSGCNDLVDPKDCDPHVYEWVEGEGVRLAGILPDDECAAAGEPPGCPAPKSIAPRWKPQASPISPHTISGDARRLFFISSEDDVLGDNENGVAGRLYMREDGAVTVRVNASERTDCAGDPTCGGDDIADPLPASEQPARWGDASEDGLIVYFATAEQLVDEDTNGKDDLYRWDAESPEGERLTLVSVDREPADPALVFAEVSQTLGTSTDGEHVYFSYNDQLVGGAPTQKSGSFRMLYHWHGGHVSFIGRIAQDGDYFRNTSHRNARITPDGMHLAFVSGAPFDLTGYNSPGGDPDCSAQESPSPCKEVYLYSVQGSTPTRPNLACASCRPDGGHSANRPGFGSGFTVRHALFAPSSSSHVRAISDDGARVFFHTNERLLPRDQNGTLADAYVYDAKTGQVHLLSTGQSNSESYWLGASADGDDSFIVTRQQLVGIDVDTNRDIYDVRVDGGITAQNSPERAPPCEADACQPPPILPNDPTPGSSALSGSGDPPLADGGKQGKCRKGTVPVGRRGKKRCVRGKRKKNQHREYRESRKMTYIIGGR